MSELADINIFFYYDTLDLNLETQHDIFLGLMQPPKSFFYDRQNSANVISYENLPNTLLLQIGLRYDIMNWISYRNTYVSDGTTDTKDRRIAASQEYMAVEQGTDFINLDVYYYMMSDYDQLKSISAKVGAINA
jgi:hypothetical protein